MQTSFGIKQRLRSQRGLGLLETLICISIMSLLFLGAMTLIVSASRSTVRTQAQVYSNSDAANAIQNIIGQLREASAFSLPTSNTAGAAESTWNSMGTTPLGQFSTTLNGETINTAIEVITPQVLTPAENGYTASVSGLRVLSQSGGYWQTGGANWPASAAPCNVQIAGGVGLPGSSVVLIYRGDANFTPDAPAGTYLWQYTLPLDSSFNPALYPPTALCKSVSPAPNAVQFVRPYYAGSGQIPEQTQVEVKIISSYYSPINGQQTSEEGNGNSSSQLSGKCVFMRDHCTASTSNTTNSGVRTGNNAFQYH
jgi:type II secretory pathway pseudopilin PulG